jgi:hypothetical protein
MAERRDFHENFRRASDVAAASERSFAIVFCVVFAIVALYPVIAGEAIRLWAAAVSLLFLAAGLFVPRVLRPLNFLWFRFGMALNRIVAPLAMGLVFFTTVTPTGLIMRALGKDPLRRRFDADAKSYWIERHPPGPDAKSMPRQF